MTEAFIAVDRTATLHEVNGGGQKIMTLAMKNRRQKPRKKVAAQVVIPADSAGARRAVPLRGFEARPHNWIPACAGMTT